MGRRGVEIVSGNDGVCCNGCLGKVKDAELMAIGEEPALDPQQTSKPKQKQKRAKGRQPVRMVIVCHCCSGLRTSVRGK